MMSPDTAKCPSGLQQSFFSTLRTRNLLKKIIITHQRLCVLFILGRLNLYLKVLKIWNQVIFVHVVHMECDSNSCWTQGSLAGKSIISFFYRKQVPCSSALNYFHKHFRTISLATGSNAIHESQKKSLKAWVKWVPLGVVPDPRRYPLIFIPSPFKNPLFYQFRSKGRQWAMYKTTSTTETKSHEIVKMTLKAKCWDP